MIKLVCFRFGTIIAAIEEQFHIQLVNDSSRKHTNGFLHFILICVGNIKLICLKICTFVSAKNSSFFKWKPFDGDQAGRQALVARSISCDDGFLDT